MSVVEERLRRLLANLTGNQTRPLTAVINDHCQGIFPHQGEEDIKVAVCTFVQKWLKVDLQYELSPSGYRIRKELDWGMTLKKAIASRFPHSKDLNKDERREWDLVAISDKLTVFRRIDIEWTDCLENHLIIAGKPSRLQVFHHVSFFQQSEVPNEFLPNGLVDETLSTLALLFYQQSEWFATTKKGEPDIPAIH
jgi:hypothetical protein